MKSKLEQETMWAVSGTGDDFRCVDVIFAEELVAALKYGIAAATNEMTARGLPAEWSPRSGIGVMLQAIGRSETAMTPELRAFLESDPERIEQFLRV